MKNAYILHGCCDRNEYFDDQYPSPSNYHWIPWLQKSLLKEGIDCQTPEFPKPYKPSYHAWAKIMDYFPINEESLIIGHSCGCGFILRYLSERPHIKLNKLIFVAPWRDPFQELGDFLNFEFSPELEQNLSKIHVLYSNDEPVKGVKITVDDILSAYKSAKLHSFNNHGHFCLNEMKTEQFPELLKLVLE
jgi:predicted alpha/beta hydrolase family esterase